MNTSKQLRGLAKPPRSAMEWLWLVLIAVLPAFLVGGTTLWACGITFVLLGVFLLIKPPLYSLGQPVNALIGLFLLLALSSFAPAGWFGLPEWRRQAVGEFSISLPPTLAPQPWLAAEAALVLLAGVSWVYLLFEAQSRSSFCMTGALKLFCAGLTLLAAVSIVLYCGNIRWPYQNAIAGFGPFPNKNQMGHVLAIGTLFSIACVYDAARHSFKNIVVWLFCAGVCFAGLVLSNSRGGLGVFLVGLTVWIAAILLVSGSRAKLAIGAATLSLVLVAFILFGGKLLERLEPPDAGGMSLSQDSRWKIQKDALSMAVKEPVSGGGLGSFEPVFSLFHHALGKTLMGNVHPESDWLWLVDEMGWFALATVLAGGFILAKSALPLNVREEHWYFKAAGLVAGLMFLLHGFVDVAGHRPGSFLVAIFAISFCAPALPGNGASPWIPRIFRAAGLFLVVAGATWVVATLQDQPLPGTLAVDKAEEDAVAAYTNSKFAAAIEISNRGLRWAPMDWRLYYDRAVGEALVDPPKVTDASADFLRARFLQPTAADLPYNEGLVWINEVAPERVFQAWEEALRRTPDDGRASMYGRMLGVGGNIAELHDYLRKLAGNDNRLILEYLVAARPVNSMAEIENICVSDPGLDSLTLAEKKNLFEIWAQSGDRAALVNRIQSTDKWLAAGWHLVVQEMAASGDYEHAYRLCRKFADLPPIPAHPSLTSDVSQPAIAAEYYSNPQDFQAAYAVFNAYRDAGEWQKAVDVADKVASQNNCPRYFFLLKAELLASKGLWQKALESLQRCIK
ncbi:MAG TPA: O-antigen ligase family protein [Chthoniobacteraceae bacterium]|nr:O-antigen ligase family protein [Chthoniobacteraceae bacterium]